MKTPFFQKPLWISHRGNHANAAENTFSAFKSATEIGFTALETDLRITKDGHIVLVHDETIARLTGNRRRVRDLTRRQLESYRIADTERFLFFDRFAESFAMCRWTLDIKPERGKRTILALAEMAKQSDFSDKLRSRAKFLTWSAAHEKLLKSFFPWAECYGRKYECWRAGLSVILKRPALGGIQPNRTYALTPSFGKIRLFKESIVRQYHKQDAKTIAFLPGPDTLARQAVRAGFDEILTNGKIIS